MSISMCGSKHRGGVRHMSIKCNCHEQATRPTVSDAVDDYTSRDGPHFRDEAQHFTRRTTREARWRPILAVSPRSDMTVYREP